MTITTTPPSSPERRARVPGRLRIRTIPGRIRALAAVGALAVLVVLLVTTLTMQDARDGLRVIGHDAGPQVVATGDLYFALSDMDAQLADALLIGGDQGLADRRAAALRTYEQRRSEANRALLQGSRLAGADATEQRTAQEMLDALGRYERLAGQALLTDEQSNHAAGPPPSAVTALYRQATDLMKLDVLPKAYNLTLDNGTKVRRTYEAKRSAVLNGRIWVVLTGLLLIAVLLGVQWYFVRRFRRLVNPFLALATVGTLVLVAVSVALLSSEAGRLRTAKEDGFDSVLALSRARAISNSAHADEARYLLDPGRADTYEQVYLDKSQTILYVPAGNLDTYYAQVDQKVGGSDFLGFYGTEAHHVTLPGQQEALRKVLSGYQKVQANDRSIRQQATGGDRRGALSTKLNAGTGDFGDYDTALVALKDLHGRAFDKAISAGDHGLRGWNIILPGAAVLLIILILAGVRPRLSEYR
ncbi:protein kinase G-activating protein GlnX [Actinoallomurus acanthiterrae]